MANQDIGAATRLGARLFQLEQSHFVDRDSRIAAIVRGYGGQSTGDLPRDITCDELARAAKRGGPLADAVRDALATAAERFRATPPRPYDASHRDASVVVLAFEPPRATVFHIGPCRAYLVRAGALRRIAQAHEVPLSGDLAGHLLRTRALGRDGDVPDEHELSIAPGDRFVLVDEGAGRVLAEPEISAAVLQTSDVQAAADRIVTIAHERAPDQSASAVVAAIQGARERL